MRSFICFLHLSAGSLGRKPLQRCGEMWSLGSTLVLTSPRHLGSTGRRPVLFQPLQSSAGERASHSRLERWRRRSGRSSGTRRFRFPVCPKLPDQPAPACWSLEHICSGAWQQDGGGHSGGGGGILAEGRPRPSC